MSHVRTNPGRVAHWDPRSDQFRIRAVAPPLATVERQFRYWNANGAWLDQGEEPHCTAAAAIHWREDGPITTKGPAKITRQALYAQIQQKDRAEGRWYDEGATSLAMVKVMRDLGWCGEYRWGKTVDELVQAVLTTGPVLVGTNWYSRMNEPDRQHRVHLGGALVGGHEFLINGVTLVHGLFRLKNSWGPAYGSNGHAWITFEDMARLIAEDGDVLLARELPEAVATPRAA